jgi:hypothetical protein
MGRRRVIKRDAKLTIRRIALSDLRVYEYQQRYPKRLRHYMRLLKRNATDDLGVLHVKPRGDGYELLDGHHRLCALIMSGRTDALCLVIEEKRP